MKLQTIYFSQILLTILLFTCHQPDAISQETNDSTRIKPGLFVGLNLGTFQSQIINEGTLSVSGLLSDKQTSFSGSLEIGYFFSNYFGLSSGLGFISYKTQLTLDAYQNKYNTTDIENDSYEMRISGSDIKEVQNIGLLYIPFCLNIRLPISKRIGFFLQPGVNLAVPLNRTYQSSGTFTYKGYYPAYNVLLENLPNYGFPNNLSSGSEGEFELKSLVFNAIASAGFDFFVGENIQFSLAACYNKSLSGISDYSSPDKFQLSPSVNQINSMMGGSIKATTQSIGLSLSLRYYFK
jgi:hypothetical protein